MWWRDVVSIALICLSLFLWRALTGWGSKLWDVAIIVVGSIAIALVEFFIFNNAPSNWIGVFSFVTLARIARADDAFDKVALNIVPMWQWLKARLGIP